MFRQIPTVTLVAIAALSSLAQAAAEPKADTTKQITNSIGMNLTLVHSGEFQMGSKESAEETAAFFNNYFSERSMTGLLFKDGLETSQANLQNSIGPLEQRISDGQGRLAALQRDLNAAITDIQQLDSAIANVEQEIETLQQ